MDGGITTRILDFISNFIPYILNNSSSIFDFLIILAELLAVFFWFYCGYFIFNDSKKRYSFDSSSVYYAFLVLGLITGPIGLGFYLLTRPRYTFDELEFMKVEHKFYYHQASKVLDCIKCGAYVLEGHSNCTNCGTQNRFKCSNCEALTDYDDMYCNNCGHHFDKRYEEIYDSVLSKEEKEAMTVTSERKLPSYDVNGAISNLKNQATGVYSRVSSKVKNLSQQAVAKASEVTKSVKDSVNKPTSGK